MTVFNPDRWLTSMMGALQDYVQAEINTVIAGVGSEVFEVVMEYPASNDPPLAAEFEKTIIRFEIDDIDNRRLGFGRGDIVQQVITAPTVGAPGSVGYQEARGHVVNLDVGIWASDKSGGVTSRLRAYEMLDKLFNSETARDRCRQQTNGIEIMMFNSGRFVVETQNDIRVFRVVGTELVLRVYGRDIPPPDVIVDVEPEQTPAVSLGDEIVVQEEASFMTHYPALGLFPYIGFFPPGP